MDSDRHPTLLERTKTFFSRVSFLEKGDLESAGYEQKIRLLKATAALLISIFLGYTAYEISSRQILAQWQRDHPPTLEVWKQSFAAYGFYPVLNLKIQHRLARKLPLMFDSNGNVWKSDNGYWWVLFYHPDPQVGIAEEMQIFSNLASPSRAILEDSNPPSRQKLPSELKQALPQQFQLLHRNNLAWDHYQKTLEELAKLAHAAPAVADSPPDPKTAPLPEYRDPREIRY